MPRRLPQSRAVPTGVNSLNTHICHALCQMLDIALARVSNSRFGVGRIQHACLLTKYGALQTAYQFFPSMCQLAGTWNIGRVGWRGTSTADKNRSQEECKDSYIVGKVQQARRSPFARPSRRSHILKSAFGNVFFYTEANFESVFFIAKILKNYIYRAFSIFENFIFRKSIFYSIVIVAFIKISFRRDW